jgi:hypothetical protein
VTLTRRQTTLVSSTVSISVATSRPPQFTLPILLVFGNLSFSDLDALTILSIRVSLG